MTKPLITFVLGTRPEAIKLAPVIIRFQESSLFSTKILLTGQHKEMVLQVFELFKLKAHKNLNLMKHGQSLNYISSSIIEGLSKEFQLNQPNLVIVQGDTTSAFSAALVAFHEKIPVAHIEAGLRTHDNMNPYPEEVNRKLISQIANLHFAPTKLSKNNLLREGIKDNVFITGNTVIDALLIISRNESISNKLDFDWENKKVIFSTLHRRENWGGNLIKISEGIKKILLNHKDTFLLMPLHKNKIVREVLKSEFQSFPRVLLTEPLNYFSVVEIIKKCTLILTDSGGLQEEAPTFGKPLLILRNNTERPEAVESGVAKLAGTNSENIYKMASELLEDQAKYDQMAKAKNPFGDGNASNKIFDACLQFLG